MKMTSKERVQASLKFSSPDRPPRDLWVLPYNSLFRKREVDAILARYPPDFDRPELSPGLDDLDLQKLSRPGKYTDEWGSIWHLAEPGVVGEVKVPVLADWEKLWTFRPPWEHIRSRKWDHVNRVCERSDRFMISGVCARLFERLQFLRGSENLYIDLGYGTSEVQRLIDMVHEYYLEDVGHWAATQVDGVMLMDDWGSNSSLLISPTVWRSVFKPLYKAYCDIIHASGKYVFFHSDGNIESIYADLVEVGVDALNSQLFCMNIEELGRRFKGKLTIWGEIDRQQILPFGTREEIQNAVQRVRRAFDDGRGGVIAQCEWGKDNSRESIEAVFEAWNS